MQIGKLARLTGCSIQTIRYYERVGLLPPPPRSTGNFRVYRGRDTDRLQFIRRCRSLDMTLELREQCSDGRTAAHCGILSELSQLGAQDQALSASS